MSYFECLASYMFAYSNHNALLIVIEYLDNKISYEEMVNKIKINTRHLVKRQYTWFKHQEENAIWIAVDKLNYDIKKIADEIIKNI